MESGLSVVLLDYKVRVTGGLKESPWESELYWSTLGVKIKRFDIEDLKCLCLGKRGTLSESAQM